MDAKYSFKESLGLYRAHFREMRKGQSGFTLLDIMVMMIIIGLLGAIAIPLFATMRKRALEAKGLSEDSAPVAPNPAPAPVKAPAADIHFPWEFILGVGVTIGLLTGLIWGSITVFRKVKESQSKIAKNLSGWKDIMDNHQRIRSEWMTYETDLLKMIKYPMLTDMSEPVTVELHKALKKAVLHSPKSLKGLDRVPFNGSDYAIAVSELDTAWQVAETKAKLSNWDSFTLDEQKQLKKAQDLLSIALDSGATSSERQISYKAAMKALKGLIQPPAKAILAIEEKVKLALTV